ncbi:GNAT family N-acetyltransferase [Marinobacterium lutimaris]|uniref:Acetyltransferase (GNAT) domain-containing protein n=1 Tax=Marinobacterium lutimaris TaxID=568106 RepID=A0A1H6DNQ2_9GAMM|nr:GNAT family N-acetyltransferase [Marinobacterium lutimaris]SEG86967.1 Acetyltransferase (GNAT) domain-containing protein [Marinobacterium lutimaris]
MSNSFSSAPGRDAGVDEEVSGVSVRVAGVADLPAMCQLSFEQGWPHRVGDWLLMLEIGEAVVLEEDAEVIGCGLRIAQGDSASLALILVRRACRGRGLGRLLMQTLIERSPTASLFLNATAEGAPLYRKYGFNDAGTVIQWQGICRASALGEAFGQLEALESADEIVQLLKRARGVDPDALIGALRRSQQRLVGVREKDALTGFACLRRFGRGWVIGPVVAATRANAARMIEALAADLDGEFLRIDLPEQTGLEPLMSSLGLSEVDRVSLMWRGEAPAPLGAERLYALFSQATG